MWLGLEALSALGDAYQHWANLTNYLVHAFNIDVVRYPFLPWLIFCAPLPLVLLALGSVGLYLNRNYRPADGEPQPAEPGPTEKPPESQSARQWNKLFHVIAVLLQEVGKAFTKKPWWFVTLFAALLMLSIYSLNLPLSVALVIGIFILVSTAISISAFIVSIVDFRDFVHLEFSALFALFCAISFTGFIAFQTDNVATLVQSIFPVDATTPVAERPKPTPTSIPPKTSSEKEKSILESAYELLRVDTSENATQTLFIVFGFGCALLGFVVNKDSPFVGLILGFIIGGIIGILMGSVVGAAINFGTWLEKAFP